MCKDWELVQRLRAKLHEISKTGYKDKQREELKELLAQCAEQVRKEDPPKA